jgi:Mrp family chromosome partitioning ATPase
MATTLEFMKDYYDYVILDAPPVGVVTDAAVLAPKVSGIVLVVRQGLASREGIDAAITKLKIANGNILGFVLVDSHTEKKSYSKYGYASSGSYGYAHPPKP